MVKIRRPSNFMLTLNTILCIFAIITSIYAANQYYLYWLQKGHQHVEKYAVSAMVANFTVKTAYVNFSEFDEKVDPSPVLNITTYRPGLNLTIHSHNHDELSSGYAILDLQVRDYYNASVVKGSLDLRTDKVLIIPLGVGTYVFDYRIYYKPSVEGEYDILLDVAIQAPTDP